MIKFTLLTIYSIFYLGNVINILSHFHINSKFKGMKFYSISFDFYSFQNSVTQRKVFQKLFFASNFPLAPLLHHHYNKKSLDVKYNSRDLFYKPVQLHFILLFLFNVKRISKAPTNKSKIFSKHFSIDSCHFISDFMKNGKKKFDFTQNL